MAEMCALVLSQLVSQNALYRHLDPPHPPWQMFHYYCKLYNWVILIHLQKPIKKLRWQLSIFHLLLISFHFLHNFFNDGQFYPYTCYYSTFFNESCILHHKRI
jgi:hypothetical protein